ncbi:MAG: HD domain-containing protein [Deltaproteobacteria bacterium]|nr:HD domain-containing protein [Deltaproteobacteria bacterium]
MGISVLPPERDLFGEERLPAGRREAFKLRALRDFTLCISRARNFEEALHLSLMVILGTFSIVKGALFLEEHGEFRVKVSRGLPPGIPPIEKTRDLVTALRRSSRPIVMGRKEISAPVRKAADEMEKAVPSFRVDFLCSLGAWNGSSGLLALGETLTGSPLTVRQRETLSVMTSVLSSHIANHRVLEDISRLNEALRSKVTENERLLDGMQEIFLDTIRALAAAIEAKDPYTRGHSERVAKISVSIAKGLGLPEDEVQAIHIASILHDVGKIGTSRSILSKRSPLSEEELLEIRRHPLTSFDILSEIRFPYPDVAALARDHHEHIDGSGYPVGKRDRQISMGAKIIALADAFDAMTSDRPYRSGLPLREALGELRSSLRRQYDPVAGRMFFRVLRDEIAGEHGGSPVFAELSEVHPREDMLRFIDGMLKEIG